jgi:type I site-specific restriction endonuclease
MSSFRSNGRRRSGHDCGVSGLGGVDILNCRDCSMRPIVLRGFFGRKELRRLMSREDTRMEEVYRKKNNNEGKAHRPKSEKLTRS